MILGINHNFTTDWWAIGVLAYEMTVGITPFKSENKDKIPEIICKKSPKYPK